MSSSQSRYIRDVADHIGGRLSPEVELAVVPRRAVPAPRQDVAQPESVSVKFGNQRTLAGRDHIFGDVRVRSPVFARVAAIPAHP